jgi:hypothetical protein
MAELFVNGFYASSQNKLYFLTFERSCSSSEEYKLELIKHAKKYSDYEIAIWLNFRLKKSKAASAFRLVMITEQNSV